MDSFDDSLMPPRRGGDGERGWSERAGGAAGRGAGPGKQTATQGIRAADPRTVLLAKLRPVRGQLAGVRERHLRGCSRAIDGRDMRAAATAGRHRGARARSLKK